MRVLVSGATGFIGTHLVPHLLQTGNHVVLLVHERYATGQPLPQPLGKLRQQLDLVYADLRNYRLTSRAVRQAGANVVIHLAAVGATDPFLPLPTALRHNLDGTLNLLRASFEGGTRPTRLIVARTPGERSPVNVYAASKAAAWQFAEMYARAYGWPIVGAMIFQAYGPGQPAATLIPAAAAAALAGEDFPMTQGEQQRDWIYVDDVARGLVEMLLAPLEAGATVELGTGRTVAVREVVQQLYRLANRGGKPLVGALASRPGEPIEQVAAAERTAAQIGWRAEVELEKGLQRLLQALESTTHSSH